MATAEDPLAEMRLPIDAEPFMRGWANLAMRRNYENLVAGNFDGPPELAHNRPYTIRRKGFDRPGFGKTGEMSLGVVNDGNVNLWVGGDEARAEVHAGPGATDMKLNIFIAGQTQPKRVAVLAGKTGEPRRKVEREVTVPGRDFVGIDERDVDAAAEDLLDRVLATWGFS